jgi:hypothetical protein
LSVNSAVSAAARSRDVEPGVVPVRFESSAAAYRLASELRRRFDATFGLEVLRGVDGQVSVRVPMRIWSMQGVPELIRSFGSADRGTTSAD